MHDGLEEQLRKNDNLTFEEVLEILEAELLGNDNPYKPLNFHDDDESF